VLDQSFINLWCQYS